VRLGVGQRVEQEVGEIAAEHLLEPSARRERLRTRIELGLRGLGD
jgi:hypothetical protein